jgi:hypothetical protein
MSADADFISLSTLSTRRFFARFRTYTPWTGSVGADLASDGLCMIADSRSKRTRVYDLTVSSAIRLCRLSDWLTNPSGKGFVALQAAGLFVHGLFESTAQVYLCLVWDKNFISLNPCFVSQRTCWLNRLVFDRLCSSSVVELLRWHCHGPIGRLAVDGGDAASCAQLSQGLQAGTAAASIIDSLPLRTNESYHGSALVAAPRA